MTELDDVLEGLQSYIQEQTSKTCYIDRALIQDLDDELLVFFSDSNPWSIDGESDSCKTVIFNIVVVWTAELSKDHTESAAQNNAWVLYQHLSNDMIPPGLNLKGTSVKCGINDIKKYSIEMTFDAYFSAGVDEFTFG